MVSSVKGLTVVHQTMRNEGYLHLLELHYQTGGSGYLAIFPHNLLMVVLYLYSPTQVWWPITHIFSRSHQGEHQILGPVSTSTSRMSISSLRIFGVLLLLPLLIIRDLEVLRVGLHICPEHHSHFSGVTATLRQLSHLYNELPNLPFKESSNTIRIAILRKYCTLEVNVNRLKKPQKLSAYSCNLSALMNKSKSHQ